MHPMYCMYVCKYIYVCMYVCTVYVRVYTLTCTYIHVLPDQFEGIVWC